MKFPFTYSTFISSVSFASEVDGDSLFIRVNQAGYLTEDTKVAIAFSEASVKGNFSLHDAETGKRIFRGNIVPSEVKAWGKFSHWGTSMFINIPETGEYPEDVHTSVWYLTKKEVPGGLMDGPVYGSVYNNLTSLHLAEPYEFSQFQNDFVVYYNDFGDYSTNEPTIDGTAGAIFMMAYLGEPQKE